MDEGGHARRSSTTYPRHTIEMNQLVGTALCEAFPDKKVDVHTPDATVVVHVVQGSTYVYAASEVGVGGLPVGTAGKVVTLLSSGFDSPVATWMVGRRGATCIPVHFSGRPMLLLASGLFVLFCGAPASAVRAWAMLAAMSGATLLGRRAHALSSVCSVACIMVSLILTICDVGG